jgi:hypothetical protein
MISTDLSDNAKQWRSYRRYLAHGLQVFLGFLVFYIGFFAPVILSDRRLAPGDGIAYFLPAFYGSKTLWTDLLFGGYPLAADIQNMTWYPPAVLLSLIPDPWSWNAFIVLAYVLAASFTYCYVYLLTRSRLAATVSGLVYSASGIMMSHLGHAGMRHPAAWLPLILCAAERLRHHRTLPWQAIGAVAIACCALGGHPQISVYGIGLSVVYSLWLGWSAPIGRWRFYRSAAGMLLAGLALAAIQLFPTFELSRLSVRAEMTFADFTTYSLPSWQALQLLFPYFFLQFFSQSTESGFVLG